MPTNDLSVLQSTGKGAMSGASTGAAIGTALLPGPGTAIGAGIGALAGGTFAGIKQNKANKANDVPLTDPLEQIRMAQLEQLRKNALTGSNLATKGSIDQIRNAGAATQGAISRNTGGDVSSTIDALLRSGKNTQASVNNAAVAGQNRLPYFDSSVGTMLNRISQRRLELQLQQRDQALAENAQARKENNVNANAAISTLGNNAFLRSNGTTPNSFMQTPTQSQNILNPTANPSQVLNPDGTPFLGSMGTDAYSFPSSNQALGL